MNRKEDNTFYILVEKEVNVRDMDSHFLLRFLASGYKTYPTYDEAEAGRQSGDAYEDPSETRVIGISITPFLPKKTTSATSTPMTSKKSKSTYSKPVKKRVKR